MTRGKLIALEGGEGSGKSTQARRLRDRIAAELGIAATLIREPGSTPLGNHLRDYLKSKQPLALNAEIMLFTAARAQLVDEVIKPSLEQGITIVADRYEASTVAYQGYGRQGNRALIDILNLRATTGLHADLTILLDLAPEAGLERAGKPQLPLHMAAGGPAAVSVPRLDQEGHRRFEDLTIAFHRRVRKGYLELARKLDHWTVVDAAPPPGPVAEAVWQAARKAL